MLPPVAPPSRLVRPKIILFGDSITQQSFTVGGWGARLADHYARKADVINRGFSGYNTTWGLAALPKVRRSSHSAMLQVP